MKHKTFSKIILAAGICLILPLLGFYLFQIGDLIRGSYLIKQYQAEIEKTSKQTLILESEAGNLLSLETAEEQIKGLNFVKVSDVSYIPIISEHLAARIR